MNISFVEHQIQLVTEFLQGCCKSLAAGTSTEQNCEAKQNITDEKNKIWFGQ